jgi:hypothetical protein
MSDDRFVALVVELQTIEWWDATERPANEDEREARKRRRLEIMREIDASTQRPTLFSAMVSTGRPSI